jgi:hypothetical protein
VKLGGGICRVNTFFQSRSLFFVFYKAKDLWGPYRTLEILLNMGDFSSGTLPTHETATLEDILDRY